MATTRRSVLLFGFGAAALAATHTHSVARTSRLFPNAPFDQTDELQQLIDESVGRTVELPDGRFRTRTLTLREGGRLVGHRTRLIHTGTGPLLSGRDLRQVTVEGLTLDGDARPMPANNSSGLVALTRVANAQLRDVRVSASRHHGIALVGCGGALDRVFVRDAGQTGIFSLDGKGVRISNSDVSLCANNGIQVWQSAPREDGAIVTGCRISDIRARAGGTGQNGNGINIFRAGGVLVHANRITDCAYSAVRGNAASNMQVSGNQIARAGEVAIYAEFGFEGAVISGNVIDTAATGISVTNFNEGGRLAVVQGNLVRNLFRREFEPVDKRGNGIAVEADAAVTGNTVEGAPTAGLVIGWGEYLRNVTATGNVFRDTGVGVMISEDPRGGSVLVSDNMIAGAKRGAIRLMDKGKLKGQDLLGRDAGGLADNLKVTRNVRG